MLPAKENLEGVELTANYAACLKELLEIFYGQTNYYFFLRDARLLV